MPSDCRRTAAPPPLVLAFFHSFLQGTTRLWERQWVASGTVMLRRWIRLDQRAGGDRAAGDIQLHHFRSQLQSSSVQRFCRRSPFILNFYTELIAAPWPGEREIFSFGNMASRSSARLENLPLTRNVAAKLSDDKEDTRSSEAGKGKSGRNSLGDKMRNGSSDNGGRGDIEREVKSPAWLCHSRAFCRSRSSPSQVMHVGVGELYCEAALFENMNHRDHIPDTVHVDRRPALPQYAPAAPPQHSSTIYTSSPRPDVSNSFRTPAPAPPHFAGLTPNERVSSNLNISLNVIVPANRDHVSWNEFQAINKGVPRERIQEVWKTTPWFKTPDPNRFAHASASERVSWNDFQRILKGKDKQVLFSDFFLMLYNVFSDTSVTTKFCRRFATFGTSTVKAATTLIQA